MNSLYEKANRLSFDFDMNQELYLKMTVIII